MIDVVMPNNNEKEFVRIAEKLGYKSLLFLYTFDNFINKKNFNNGTTKTYNGILANQKNIQKVNNKFRNKKVFIAIKSSNSDRETIEEKQANLVFSLEEKGRKDFMHQRGSGLDHILAKLAHQNNIILGFSLNSIINSNKRNVILGRIMQNIKLCRKYKVKTVIGSFTQNPMEMRSPQDIVSLFTTLGMTQKEVKDSLNNVL